jgi:hypothetical protein
MYTKNTDYDTKQIARDIYNQLRLDYRYNRPTYLTLDEAIKSLNEKLKKLKYHEVLCWSQALIALSEVNTTGHPPTAQEIIKAIKKAAFRYIEEASYYTSNPVDDTSQIDYSCLWVDADDKAKFRFFIDYRFDLVPSHIRLSFAKYNKEHRGWTFDESNKMMRWWMKPFPGANDGAMIIHHREIIDYFTNRKIIIDSLN